MNGTKIKLIQQKQARVNHEAYADVIYRYTKENETIRSIVNENEEDIIGLVQSDESLLGSCWGWRILKIFEDPRVAVVGTSSFIQTKNSVYFEGYWYSPERHQPPIGIRPLIWPVSPVSRIGPSPFFFRRGAVLPRLGRWDGKINTYTATKLSEIMSNANMKVVATAIPFSKTNFYIAHEEIK